MSLSQSASRDVCWLCKLQLLCGNLRKDLQAAGLYSCEASACGHCSVIYEPSQRSPAEVAGKTIPQPTSKYHPLVCLDGVPEWSCNERFYIFGLSAWLRVKPFVSFFSHGFCMKTGTVAPCLLHEPFSGRQRLVWHVFAGFPDDDEVATFRKALKVWLKLPARSDESFRSLLHSSLQMHFFNAMCHVCSGSGVLLCGEPKNTNVTLRSFLGVECDEGTAAFFKNSLHTSFLEQSHWQQYLTQMIVIGSDDSNHADVSQVDERLLVPSMLSAEVCGPPQDDMDDVQVDECTHLNLKAEVKHEEDCGFEVDPSTAISPCTPVLSQDVTLSGPLVACPGCPAVYPANRIGYNALSHHFLNSHRQQAHVYQRSLRMKRSMPGVAGAGSDPQLLVKRR